MVSVLDPVTRHAEATPENIAIRGTDNHWTYRQLHDASLAFAGRIRDEGLSIGDRVLLAAPSVPEFIVAYMGIQAAGCVVVPINTMSAQPEVEYVLDDAEISLAIAWHQLGPAVQDAGSARGVPVWTLTEESAKADHPPATVVDRDAADTTAILYTSGTTGRPKGAQLTVGNLLSAGEIGAESSRGNPSDRTGTGLPLFHIFGQGSVMMATFTGGGSLSLLARFDRPPCSIWCVGTSSPSWPASPPCGMPCCTPQPTWTAPTSNNCGSQSPVAHHFPVKSLAPSKHGSTAQSSRLRPDRDERIRNFQQHRPRRKDRIHRPRRTAHRGRGP